MQSHASTITKLILKNYLKKIIILKITYCLQIYKFSNSSTKLEKKKIDQFIFILKIPKKLYTS